MNNPRQSWSWILGICRRVAGVALALAIMLVPVVLATGSAQAQTFTTLHTFDGTDGAQPNAVLAQGTDGNLYGTGSDGGVYSYGMIFKITPTGTLTTLYSFCGQENCPDGYDPNGVVQATNGDFYGTTVWGGTGANETCSGNGQIGCGTVFKITPNGKLTTLHSFAGAEGSAPNGLVQGTDGNFYGTTSQGGNGGGTVFKITTGGTLTTLYTFCSQPNCTDGGAPSGALVQATDGNFYGTAFSGATVFKITPTGKLTTLVTVGGWPSGGVIQADDGNFYGTDAWDATIFKVTPGGTLTTLGYVGGYPYAGLVQATDGNFYGTTYVGGANNNYTCEGNGCGSLFEITPAGTLTTVYNFCSQPDCTDGYWPLAGLMQATNGNLYGTTWGDGWDAGAYSVYGSVFSLGMGFGPFVETRPTYGKVGTAVIILGNNLTGSTRVSFNGTAAVFKVVSSSEITTAVPTGASSGTVQVVTPSGTLSSNVPFRLPATATTTTLTSSPNPSTYGQAVTFTVEVTSKLGAPPDGETVSFMKGTAVLGTGTLIGGSASFMSSTLKAGSNAITAVYGGDAKLASSKSKAVSQVVGKATTTTALASSLNPSKVGQSVTFTASVTPEFSSTVTGNVTFYDATTLLKTVALSGGAAKYITSKLTAGTHSITATYNGSTSFTGSSASLTQTVN